MRKRTAVLVFGGILLAMAGYVAWCARPFYVRPGVAYDENVPQEARHLIAELWERTGGLPPAEFDWELLTGNLADPWHARVEPAPAWMEPDHGSVLVAEPAPGRGYKPPALLVILVDRGDGYEIMEASLER